jgi:histidinol-phosphate aminotransferase
MPEYHPPLSGRGALRLDFNENTVAPSPLVLIV